MPLKRANSRFLSDAENVRFLMQEGWVEMLCQIDFKTLSLFGRAIGLSGPLEIFEAHRDRFERAASDKYDRTTRHVYEVITVAATDLDLTKD